MDGNRRCGQMADFAEMIDARLPKLGAHEPYKKQT
jgi:hypothetical protein